MKIKNLREIINQEAKRQKLEIVSHSSNISWLYPGQFAYCLNEEFLWDRYGSFTDAPTKTHFHKIQPVIRWDDFISYFQGAKGQDPENDNSHLSHFDMSTITGGHIISSEDTPNYESQAFKGLFDFLTNTCGLDKRNFEVSYFPGAKLSDIGKGKNGFSKYDFDFDFTQDLRAKELLAENDIRPCQIKPDAGRNCFLIPNWVCGEVAPWGYRNEINYKTPRGLVDIATIERLSLIPKKQNGEIIGVEPWEKSFVISGTGLERLSMLSEGLEKIQDVDNIKHLYETCLKYEDPLKVCESLRMLHRIAADSRGDLSDSRGSGKNRKPKYNQLLRNLYKIERSGVKDMLEINSEINSWHPELGDSEDLVISELKRYSLTQK